MKKNWILLEGGHSAFLIEQLNCNLEKITNIVYLVVYCYLHFILCRCLETSCICIDKVPSGKGFP